MQIPYTIESIVIYPSSVYSLFGDDWDLRFCALITVGALFYLFSFGGDYGKERDPVAFTAIY